MPVPGFTHLPHDLAAGIAAYDEMRDDGMLTYGDDPAFDQPTVDGVPYEA